VQILTAFVIWLLLSTAALADSTVSTRILAGLDEHGQPIAALAQTGLSFSWEGILTGELDQPVSQTYVAADVGPDMLEVRRLLQLPENDPTLRIYITPSNSQVGQQRLVAVSRKSGDAFRCRIYDRQNLILVSELDLSAILSGLHGQLPQHDDALDCHVLALARNSTQDLILMLSMSYADKQYFDFGIWNGMEWLQIDIKDGPVASRRLSGKPLSGDPFRFDRIYVGPADEIMYCAGSRDIHFLTRDTAGGAYSLAASYNTLEVAQQLGISLPAELVAEVQQAEQTGKAGSTARSNLPFIMGGLLLLAIVLLALRRRRDSD
jgi:MYXO-CTERM domain-containing protein